MKNGLINKTFIFISIYVLPMTTNNKDLTTPRKLIKPSIDPNPTVIRKHFTNPLNRAVPALQKHLRAYAKLSNSPNWAVLVQLALMGNIPPSEFVRLFPGNLADTALRNFSVLVLSSRHVITSFHETLDLVYVNFLFWDFSAKFLMPGIVFYYFMDANLKLKRTNICCQT